MIESNCNQTNSSLSNSSKRGACIHHSPEQNTQKASGLSPSIARVLFSYRYQSILAQFHQKSPRPKEFDQVEVEVYLLLGELVRSAFNLYSHGKAIALISGCTMLIER